MSCLECCFVSLSECGKFFEGFWLYISSSFTSWALVSSRPESKVTLGWLSCMSVVNTSSCCSISKVLRQEAACALTSRKTCASAAASVGIVNAESDFSTMDLQAAQALFGSIGLCLCCGTIPIETPGASEGGVRVAPLARWSLLRLSVLSGRLFLSLRLPSADTTRSLRSDNWSVLYGDAERL